MPKRPLITSCRDAVAGVILMMIDRATRPAAIVEWDDLSNQCRALGACETQVYTCRSFECLVSLKRRLMGGEYPVAPVTKNER